MSTLFEDIGGETVLRSVIADFVARMFVDPMIGFFFFKADRARITEMEYQHAAQHLGGPVTYSGRPLRQAHAQHRIMGGQFMRRRELLRRTLLDHKAPGHVIEAFLAHVDSLRGEITGDHGGTECLD